MKETPIDTRKGRVGAAARAVAALRTQFDRVASSFRAGAGPPARDPAAALAAAEEALRAMEREVAARRADADEAAHAAADWELKAVLAINAGRDEMAKRALSRQAEHADHAASEAQIAAHLEEALGVYRGVVDDLRARTAARSAAR